MIAALGTPARRIALAVALSALAHVLLLSLPPINIPHDDIRPPPLTAKLDPLPKLVAKPVKKPAAQQKPSRQPHPAINPSAPAKEPDNAIAAAPNPAALSAVEAASAVAALSSVAAQPASAVAEEQEAPPPLPRHAQLSFYVYKGLNHFQIGTINHRLEISSNEYTLKAVTQTTGLAKFFKNYQLTQISRGKVENQGLQPETFEEEKINDSEKQSIKATFDWSSQKLRFSQGGETALPVGAQDILGIFYQLSQLSLNKEVIPLDVSNGKKLEKYELGIGLEEEITTPMGKLRALHLSKLHAKGESGLEIWLGLDYRLFPVKYLLLEPSGEVAGEIVVSDIRVADE